MNERCACGQHPHRPTYPEPQPETRGDFLRSFGAFAALIVAIYIITLVSVAATLEPVR